MAGKAQVAIPPSPPLSAEELKTFQLAPGFRAELVASEPLVGDPVAMQFGHDGRLWVEMRSYMPDLDGRGEVQPTGRVVVLTDTEGDGRMDKSDVFLDQLIMPRAVARQSARSLRAARISPSTDERFHPVNLSTGPDGALYISDFYRGVIQHRLSLTTYLRKQSEARALAQPIGLGRIWRIVPEKGRPSTQPKLHQETPAQWVAHLSHPNAWWRETAQRLLVDRGDLAVVPALEVVLESGTQPLGRLHALWTLDGLNRASAKIAIVALGDSDPRVRGAALRASESLLPSVVRRNQYNKRLVVGA